MSGEHVTCGCMSLVDSAPLIIARELGFAADEGLDLTLVTQPSWSALRDMLAMGHLDAAQMLAPMPVAMSMGLGGLSGEIDALMVMSVNGTVIGVSRPLASQMRAQGYRPALGLPTATADAVFKAAEGVLRVGVPFPYSMHRLLLEYWLRAHPAAQTAQISVITVPPARMAAAVENGQIDMFCVGEPWGSVAVGQGVAELILPGAAIWQFAPEKVLAARRDWIEARPDTARALLRAVWHACKWLDTGRNKPLAVEILARSAQLTLPEHAIDPAISGRLIVSPGGSPVEVDRFLVFHRHAANFPWRSQAGWIAGQLGATPEQTLRGKQSFRADLYRETLGVIGADLPGASEKIEGTMRHATAVASTRGHMILGPDAFFDGKTFDVAPDS